jgi:dTDP-4-dehydrorhamnose reductase
VTRALVTGAGGLLGSALLATAPEGVEARGTTRREVDLADAEATAALVADLGPDLIVHTAYSMADLAQDVVAATASLAATGVDLIHLSSDVVFDGEHAPYAEDDPLDPVHAYGRAKVEAERLVADGCIVRTSLLCAAAPLDPRSAWVVGALRAGEELRLFTDEIRCPLRADDLARMLWDLVALPAAERAGRWHLVGPEAMSRYDLGCVLADAHGLDRDAITPARSAEAPGRRPRDLRLTSRRAGALPTRPRPVRTLWG